MPKPVPKPSPPILLHRITTLLGPQAIPGPYDRDLGRQLTPTGQDYINPEHILTLLTTTPPPPYPTLKANLLSLGLTTTQVESLLKARDQPLPP